VTAGYNPSTNGKTEKANDTITRKHAESSIDNWTNYIPSVMLAYNSKVHESTGFTPFELDFGRKMNNFNNWNNKINLAEAIALENRTNEIQDLIKSKQQKALCNISDKQAIQQDKSNLVTKELLAWIKSND
jgi:hypothetical protein